MIDRVIEILSIVCPFKPELSYFLPNHESVNEYFQIESSHPTARLGYHCKTREVNEMFAPT